MTTRSLGGMVPLGFMSQGETGVLAEIRGPRHHDHGGMPAPHAGPGRKYRRGHMFHSDRGHRLEHRLNHMGLIPGVKVKVIQNNAPGPVIVGVRESRICLGRGVANRVLVEPDEAGGRRAGIPAGEGPGNAGERPGPAGD